MDNDGNINEKKSIDIILKKQWKLIEIFENFK